MVLTVTGVCQGVYPHALCDVSRVAALEGTACTAYSEWHLQMDSIQSRPHKHNGLHSSPLKHPDNPCTADAKLEAGNCHGISQVGASSQNMSVKYPAGLVYVHEVLAVQGLSLQQYKWSSKAQQQASQ